MGVTQHLIRRLLMMIPLIIGITVLLFVVTHIVPVNPLALAITNGATFVAQGFAGDAVQTIGLIKAGIEHKGFSLINILQPCPMLVYLLPSPVEVETKARDGNLNLSSVAQMSTIAALGGVQVKPELGHIFFTSYDCLLARTSQVSVKVDTVDSTTAPIYISDNGVPSDVLAETQKKGEGAVINVPPGFITVTASHAKAGMYFSLTVAVRAGHITALPIAPSP